MALQRKEKNIQFFLAIYTAILTIAIETLQKPMLTKEIIAALSWKAKASGRTLAQEFALHSPESCEEILRAALEAYGIDGFFVIEQKQPNKTNAMYNIAAQEAVLPPLDTPENKPVLDMPPFWHEIDLPFVYKVTIENKQTKSVTRIAGDLEYVKKIIGEMIEGD